MYPPICPSSVLLAQLKGLTVVVMVAEELKHDVEEQEVYTVEVLISMRNLDGSSN